VIVQDVIAEEHMVAVRWRTAGFHEGDFMGIPPTGKHIRVEVMGFFLVQNGQITEGWVIDDHFSLRKQLMEM
jgi:predicted ester cyclase